MSTFEVTVAPPAEPSTAPAPAPAKKPRTRKPKIKVTYLRLFDLFNGKAKGMHRPSPDPAKREADELNDLRRSGNEVTEPPPTYLTST